MPLKSLWALHCSVSPSNSNLYTVTFKSQPLGAERPGNYTLRLLFSLRPSPVSWTVKTELHTCDQAAPFIKLQAEALWPVHSERCRTPVGAQGWIFKQSIWSPDSSFHRARKASQLGRSALTIPSRNPASLFGCRLPFFLASSQWKLLYKCYLLSGSLAMECDRL